VILGHVSSVRDTAFPLARLMQRAVLQKVLDTKTSILVPEARCGRSVRHSGICRLSLSRTATALGRSGVRTMRLLPMLPRRSSSMRSKALVIWGKEISQALAVRRASRWPNSLLEDATDPSPSTPPHDGSAAPAAGVEGRRAWRARRSSRPTRHRLAACSRHATAPAGVPAPQ